MSGIRRLSILAVEDEAMIALELEDMLEELGYEVIGPAATIEAALQLLERSSPDAAVVDANLGGETAKPIVDALRAEGVPVVLASGYEAHELRSFGLEGHLVRKPYNTLDLAKALEAVCAAPPRQSGLG